MIAAELINQMIPPLKLSDPVSKAIQWMEELRVRQLPVIHQDAYQGLILEDNIYQLNNQQASVADLSLQFKDVFIRHTQHFYEILRLASLNQLRVMAVIGEEQNFLGVVTVSDTLLAFADSLSMRDPGGILVLLLDYRDYSLAEISRLVESNDAKILNTNVSTDKDETDKLRITLKINKTDLSRIVATFERFNYRIVAKFQPSDFQEMDKERLDLLFKYLYI
ncbi:MAG: CBS domain-containing protein [Bacteroidota bacterium]